MAVEGFRLPKASNVYRGIEFTAIAEAKGSIAPFARSTHASGEKGTLRIRFTLAGFGTEYVLHPHCVGSTDREPRVALYVAVNPRGARTSGDYYVGPDDVDRFAEHAATFAMAAGQLYGISGNPRPYEIHTALMIDNAMHGRPVDALISFSKAWREALKDPVWYVMAVPAVLGASIAGGPRAPVGTTAAARALPSEIEMLRMISADGQLERGLLVRELKGRYLIRAEGVADIGPGDFFNGPYKSLPEARAAAQRHRGSDLPG